MSPKGGSGETVVPSKSVRLVRAVMSLAPSPQRSTSILPFLRGREGRNAIKSGPGPGTNAGPLWLGRIIAPQCFPVPADGGNENHDGCQGAPFQLGYIAVLDNADHLVGPLRPREDEQFSKHSEWRAVTFPTRETSHVLHLRQSRHSIRPRSAPHDAPEFHSRARRIGGAARPSVA